MLLFHVANYSVPILSDTIDSDKNMAIGTILMDCLENSSILKEGFCEKIFREVHHENNTVELQLFDKMPNLTFCSVNCYIRSADIYDSKGNRLNLTISRGENPEHASTNQSAFRIISISIFFIMVLLILSFTLSFLFFKSRHKKKKNDIS